MADTIRAKQCTGQTKLKKQCERSGAFLAYFAPGGDHIKERCVSHRNQRHNLYPPVLQAGYVSPKPSVQKSARRPTPSFEDQDEEVSDDTMAEYPITIERPKLCKSPALCDNKAPEKLTVTTSIRTRSKSKSSADPSNPSRTKTHSIVETDHSTPRNKVSINPALSGTQSEKKEPAIGDAEGTVGLFEEDLLMLTRNSERFVLGKELTGAKYRQIKESIQPKRDLYRTTTSAATTVGERLGVHSANIMGLSQRMAIGEAGQRSQCQVLDMHAGRIDGLADRMARLELRTGIHDEGEDFAG